MIRRPCGFPTCFGRTAENLLKLSLPRRTIPGVKTNYGRVTTVHEAACNRCDYKVTAPNTAIAVSLLTAHHEANHEPAVTSLAAAINGVVDNFDWEEDTNDSLVMQILDVVEEDRKNQKRTKPLHNVDPAELIVIFVQGLTSHSTFYSHRPMDTRILAEHLARRVLADLA